MTAAGVVLAVVTVIALGSWAANSSDEQPRVNGTPTPTSSAATQDEPTTAPPSSFTVTARPGQRVSEATDPERPVEVVLPSAAEVPVRVASTDPTGKLDVPVDIDLAGWWDGGARLGDPYGAMVLASHVDSTTQGLGPFAELLDVAPGDELSVESEGLAQEFGVETVDLVPRRDLDTRDRLFSQRGGLRLVLVTCAGPFDASNGGYQNLAVVTAEPTGPLTTS